MTAYNDTILADSPSIYVPMDGSTSTNLGSRSISVTASAGTSFVAGKQGQAVLMSGPSVPSYINYNVGTHDYFNDGTWAVELWFKKTTAGDTGYMELLNTYDGTAANSFTIYGSDGTGKLAAWYKFNGGTQYKITGPTINDTNWHHIVVSSDGTNVRLYLDSVEVGTAGVASNGAFPSGTNIWMGAYGTSAGNENWNGQIDEWAIYPSSLSTTRISAHYLAGNSAQYSATAMTASASLPMPSVVAQRHVSVSVGAMTASASLPNAYAATRPLSVSQVWAEVDSANTSTNKNTQTQTVGTMYEDTTHIAYVVPDLSGLPVGAVIGNAELKLNIVDVSGTSPRRVGAKAVTSSFNPTTVTWATKPTLDSTEESFTQLTGSVVIPTETTLSVVNAVRSIQSGTAYGIALTASTSGFGIATPDHATSGLRPVLSLTYWVSGDNSFSAGTLDASASLVNPSVSVGTGASLSVSPLTASGSLVMPSSSINEDIAVSPMTADASLVVPELSIPDRNINVSAMTADASMPGGGFTNNPSIAVTPLTANASMPPVSVSGELNARVNASVMNSVATIIPPVEAQGNDSDPYYMRLNSQITQRGSLWYRLDEISGTTAHNERPDGTTLNDGTYVGGVTLGISGLEGRKIARFDGVDDGILLPDNDGLVAGGTFEFVFRTTKATQTIVEGIDFNFNNFGGALRGTMIGLTNGKIDIFPSNAGQYTGLTSLNDGQWHHVVVTFYRFGNAALNYPGQLAVYVDGRVELKRYLLENQIFVAVPDSIGGVGSRVETITTTIGQRATSIPFEGDIMEFAFQPDKILSETEAIRNYYYAFGYNPIYVEPMTASAEAPNVIGKGNQKRALALFFNTDTDENLALPNYWDTYNWTGIRTSDTFGGQILRHYGGRSAPFDLGGFKVFPKSIQREETRGVDEYLGGAYYDYVTGEGRYIDLTTDIDVSDYDLVFFLNLPPKSANEQYGTPASAKNWENMVDSLRAAQDEHGFSIWAPQPDLAVQLGIIDRWTVHSMLRETFVSDSQGNASGLYDARSPQINPWNEGSGEISDPKYYYDTHAANKYRIVSLLDDFTTLGGYIIDDYFYGRPRDPYKIPFEGWKYREIASGLQIGDEMYYPQDFWAIAGSSSWLGVHNTRRSVVAVPSENVKAGTILTKENDTHYVGTNEVANPFADYATSIVVKPGDTLKGRQANGKIYVNFMEGADGNFGALRKQVVPPNEQIPNPANWEDSAKRAWDYASYRVSATAISTGSGQNGPTGGAGQTPISGEDAVESPSSGGGFVVGVNESEKYPVVFLTQHGMLERAFNWLSIRDEVEPGDKIVRPDTLKANASMSMPVVSGQKSATVNATAMLATAQMSAPAQAHGPDAQVIVLPMTAFGSMVGVGRTISVEPMTATATLVENFDMVHAGGDQIVLYLHYSDAIIYMKEDA